MINYYQKRKMELICEAQKWQNDFSKIELDWVSYANKVDWFYEQAKKFGLVREFKENGII